MYVVVHRWFAWPLLAVVSLAFSASCADDGPEPIADPSATSGSGGRTGAGGASSSAAMAASSSSASGPTGSTTGGAGGTGSTSGGGGPGGGGGAGGSGAPEPAGLQYYGRWDMSDPMNPS